MSYVKIFSVVNEKTASTVMGRYAISLAAACKAALVLYAAHDTGADEAVLQHTAHHLEHLAAIAAELEIPVTRIMEVGNISSLLPKRVEAEQADLVFYPLTPYKRSGSDLQRQTVHTLLRTVTSDLAVMRIISLARPHPGQILVPLGKVISNREQRLLFITELAKSFHARVTLFHLATERDGKGMPAEVTSFRKELQQQQITTQERIGRGHVGKGVTVEAISHHNDLIVIGVSQRGFFRRLFSGNPVVDVMHQPPCNTVLFRGAL